MSKRDNEWSKLDNTAKVFPAISGEHAANVFRLWAKLDEYIDQAVLENAVNIAKEEVPSFNVKMRRGLFWYYFETNNNKHNVREEANYPCSRIDIRRNQMFLFKVTYYKNRINLEVFHALADGAGAMYFLERIICNYLKLRYPDEMSMVAIKDDISAEDMNVDAFIESYRSDIQEHKEKMIKAPHAYKIDGELIPWGNQQVLEIFVETGDILRLAREKGVTASEYTVAMIMQGIYVERFTKHPENKPIIISVPVNLRNLFETNTLRNFFIFVRIGINFYDKEYSFEEILAEVQKQMKEQVRKELFLGRIKQQVELEKKWIFRAVPRFIKDFAVKEIYRSGESAYTCTFTNLGRVSFNPALAKHIEIVGTMLAASRNNVLKMALTSFENRMVFSFNSNIYQNDIQRYFIKHLTDRDIKVTISCNEVNHI